MNKIIFAARRSTRKLNYPLPVRVLIGSRRKFGLALTGKADVELTNDARLEITLATKPHQRSDIKFSLILY